MSVDTSECLTAGIQVINLQVAFLSLLLIKGAIVSELKDTIEVMEA